MMTRFKLPVSQAGHPRGRGAHHHVLLAPHVHGGQKREAAEEQVLHLRVRPLLRPHRDGLTLGVAPLSKGFPRPG